MCGNHPCSCAGLGILVTQAEERFVNVYGPASVQVVSEDKKLISMAAIRAALPQLLRRKRLSIMHKDQLVGEIHEAMEVHADEATNPKAFALVKAHGGILRTTVRPVTEADAEAFPKLRPFMGQDQLFVAATVFGDNKTSMDAQSDVKTGVLDSFSISGMATQAELVPHCDDRGCQQVLEVREMDLSAVTLASSTDVNAAHGHYGARARNPAAGLIVITQAEHDKDEKHRRTAPQTLINEVIAWAMQDARARGHSFKDFAECEAWAKDKGLKDPAAFCGALERETREAGHMFGKKEKETEQATETGSVTLEAVQQAFLELSRRVEALEQLGKGYGEMMAQAKQADDAIKAELVKLSDALSKGVNAAAEASKTSQAEAQKLIAQALDNLGGRVKIIEEARAHVGTRTPDPSTTAADAAARAKAGTKALIEAADSGDAGQLRRLLRELRGVA